MHSTPITTVASMISHSTCIIYNTLQKYPLSSHSSVFSFGLTILDFTAFIQNRFTGIGCKSYGRYNASAEAMENICLSTMPSYKSTKTHDQNKSERNKCVYILRHKPIHKQRKGRTIKAKYVEELV